MDMIGSMAPANGMSARPVKDTVCPQTGEAPPTDRVSVGESAVPPAWKPSVSRTEQPDMTEPLFHASAPPPMVPGPAGTLLGKELRAIVDRNAAFLLKRGFHIPFLMDEYKPINADKAEKILREGGESGHLFVNLGDDRLIAINKVEDAGELSSFLDAERPESLTDRGAAGFIKNAAAEGFSFSRSDGSLLNTYQAYRILVPPEKSDGTVILEYGGVKLSKLSAESIREADRLKTLMNDVKIADLEFPDGKTFTEAVIAPIGSTSFNDRLDALKRLRELYSNGRNQSYSIDDYQKLREYAGQGADLATLTRAYAILIKSMAAATGLSPSPSEEGMNFLASHLKDSALCSSFIQMAGSGMNVHSLNLIHGGLAASASAEDFEKTAQLFKGNPFWTSDRIELVMAPAGEIPLSDRMKTLADMSGRIKFSGTGRNINDYIFDDYRHMVNLSKNGEDLSKLSNLYNSLFDASPNASRHYWSSDISGSLDYIAGSLMESPRRFSCFVSLMQSGCNGATARQSMESLPQPSQEGAFDEIGQALKYMRKKFNYGESSGNVRASADDCLIRDVEHLKKLSSSGDEFAHLSSLYARMLQAHDQNAYWMGDYSPGMDYIAENLKDDPRRFDCFIELVESTGSAEVSRKVMEILPVPEDGAKYGEMGQALKCMRRKFNYGESSGDIRASADDCLIRDVEHLKILSSSGDEFVQLASLYVRFLNTSGPAQYWTGRFAKAIDDLSSALKNCPFMVPLYLFEQANRETLKITDEDIKKDYELMAAAMGTDESLSRAEDCFSMLQESLSTIYGNKDRPTLYRDIRDAYLWLAEQKKNGCPLQDTAALLYEALITSKSLDEAKTHVSYASQPEKNLEMLDDGNVMVIDGVRMKIRQESQEGH